MSSMRYILIICLALLAIPVLTVNTAPSAMIIMAPSSPWTSMMSLTVTYREPLFRGSTVAELLQKQSQIFNEIIRKLIKEVDDLKRNKKALECELDDLRDIIDIQHCD